MPPGTSVVPTETPKERAQAQRDFKEGMKLKSSGKLDQAFEKFEKAAELSPRNLDYITAREFTRQQLVMQALERGNKAMLENKEIVAMAEFRRATEYDPTNDFAIQRLRDSMPEEWSRSSHSHASGGAVHSHRAAAFRGAPRFSLSRRRPSAAHPGCAGLRRGGRV